MCWGWFKPVHPKSNEANRMKLLPARTPA